MCVTCPRARATRYNKFRQVLGITAPTTFEEFTPNMDWSECCTRPGRAPRLANGSRTTHLLPCFRHVPEPAPPLDKVENGFDTLRPSCYVTVVVARVWTCLKGVG
jgi:hypothetical protein